MVTNGGPVSLDTSEKHGYDPDFDYDEVMTVVDSCGRPDFVQLELERNDNRYVMAEKDSESRWGGWLKPSCIPITVILILIILVVLLPLLDQQKETVDKEYVLNFLNTFDRCKDTCRFTVVESIPENLTFTNGSVNFLSVYDGWKQLLKTAKQSIYIASSYWTLRGVETHFTSSNQQGADIFKELLLAGTERGIKILIAQNEPSHYQPNHDTVELHEKGAATVRSVNFQRLLGGGVLHTKFWVVDNQHFYLGSANMDWRSLTQVKEVGVIVFNCSCLAEDIGKIFEIYWQLGVPDAKIPPSWPRNLDTEFNNTQPANVTLNGTLSQVYIASSPPPFCTQDRTTDIDAILDVIDKAKSFVYISVMDYFPTMIYTRHNTFWPVIDNKIRQVAIERGIRIRLLASHWNHTMPSMPYYLSSLAALNSTFSGISIEVKMFVVPFCTKEQTMIPYARVNHNKYMVTDNAAYIGTSNWSGDYFVNTGGASVIVNQTWPSDNSTNSSTIAPQIQPIREQMLALFERDWTSQFAHPLSQFLLGKSSAELCK